jgi:hypothetical protein
MIDLWTRPSIWVGVLQCTTRYLLHYGVCYRLDAGYKMRRMKSISTPIQRHPRFTTLTHLISPSSRYFCTSPRAAARLLIDQVRPWTRTQTGALPV